MSRHESRSGLPTPPGGSATAIPSPKAGSNPLKPQALEEEIEPGDGPETSPEEEEEEELPPAPPVPPQTPPHTAPSEHASLKSELREMRELAQVHHNLVQSLIQQMAQMRDLFNQACERLTSQSEQHAATLDIWQDHVATQEEWIERLEDVTAAHIRMLQEQTQQ